MSSTAVPGAAGEHERDAAREPGAGEEPTAVLRVASAQLPTRHGAFEVVGYEHPRTGSEQVALVAGGVEGLSSGGPVLVRVHSECLTGDALGSLRCDCGPQLDAALDAVGAEGRGVVVYLRGHEGRGIGLLPKLAAYALQDAGRDTLEANLDLGLPADARDYAAAAGVLRDLGVRHVRLLTNNLRKVEALAEHGVEVTERVPLVVGVGPENRHYLEVKRDRMGHQLAELDEDDPAPRGDGPRGDIPHERTTGERTTRESTTGTTTDDEAKEQGR